MKIEPHFLAAFYGSEAATLVLDFLPSTDLIEILRNLIYIQHEIFCHMMEGKHYGSNQLQDYIEYTYEVKNEIVRLKDAD